MTRQTSPYAIIVLLIIPIVSPSFALEENNLTEVTSPRLVNSFGAPVVDLLNVNQQVQITADVKNLTDATQNFTYIVQIKNENDIVVSLSWISGLSLAPNQTLSPAISWMPHSPGTFTAEIYVWESLKNQFALAKQVDITAIVS